MAIDWRVWWDGIGVAVGCVLGVIGMTSLANAVDRRIGGEGWVTGAVAVLTALILVGVVSRGIVIGG